MKIKHSWSRRRPEEATADLECFFELRQLLTEHATAADNGLLLVRPNYFYYFWKNFV
jgi:hypothetical protein